ncbi:MAG TPA: hypothetical protein VF892_04280 [Pseudonocardiaceae bacterium]
MRPEPGQVLHTVNAHVATEPVTPLGPAEPVDGLLALHEQAGIQLRVLPTLWPFWNSVTTTTLGFSGIRLRNAHPAKTAGHDTPTSRSPIG